MLAPVVPPPLRIRECNNHGYLRASTAAEEYARKNPVWSSPLDSFHFETSSSDDLDAAFADVYGDGTDQSTDQSECAQTLTFDELFGTDDSEEDDPPPPPRPVPAAAATANANMSSTDLHGSGERKPAMPLQSPLPPPMCAACAAEQIAPTSLTSQKSVHTLCLEVLNLSIELTARWKSIEQLVHRKIFTTTQQEASSYVCAECLLRQEEHQIKTSARQPALWQDPIYEASADDEAELANVVLEASTEGVTLVRGTGEGKEEGVGEERMMKEGEEEEPCEEEEAMVVVQVDSDAQEVLDARIRDLEAELSATNAEMSALKKTNAAQSAAAAAAAAAVPAVYARPASAFVSLQSATRRATPVAMSSELMLSEETPTRAGRRVRRRKSMMLLRTRKYSLDTKSPQRSPPAHADSTIHSTTYC